MVQVTLHLWFVWVPQVVNLLRQKWSKEEKTLKTLSFLLKAWKPFCPLDVSWCMDRLVDEKSNFDPNPWSRVAVESIPTFARHSENNTVIWRQFPCVVIWMNDKHSGFAAKVQICMKLQVSIHVLEWMRLIRLDSNMIKHVRNANTALTWCIGGRKFPGNLYPLAIIVGWVAISAGFTSLEVGEEFGCVSGGWCKPPFYFEFFLLDTYGSMISMDTGGNWVNNISKIYNMHFESWWVAVGSKDVGVAHLGIFQGGLELPLLRAPPRHPEHSGVEVE